MIDFDSLEMAKPAPLEPCQHEFGVGLVGGGWTMAAEGPYAGLWVHAQEDCLRASAANLQRVGR